MKSALHPRTGLIVYGGLALLALVLAEATELPFWVAFLISVVGFLINGFVATLEDDLPGGFANLDGEQTPPYAAAVVAIGRVLLPAFLLLSSAAFALTAVAFGVRSIPFFGACSLSCALLAAGRLAKVSWPSWVALALLVVAFGVVLWPAVR